nr:trinucleotide repeat-containing gene 18 protein-like [Ipomoea batatas]
MGTTSTIVLLLLLSLIITQSCWQVDGHEVESHIYIYNQLPQVSDIFKLHCFSKDDDLGYHDISRANSPFTWTFVDNFWGTTLFACHFWWGSKDRAFEVYGGQIRPEIDTYKLHYYVRSDGFYLSHVTGSDHAIKVLDW